MFAIFETLGFTRAQAIGLLALVAIVAAAAAGV